MYQDKKSVKQYSTYTYNMPPQLPLPLQHVPPNKLLQTERANHMHLGSAPTIQEMLTQPLDVANFHTALLAVVDEGVAFALA